jgi:hypothetical protein
VVLDRTTRALSGSCWRCSLLEMSTFQEIESAARRLTADERRRLLISLAESLRAEARPLPAPRSFTRAEVEAWIKEDERDLADYRRG